MSSVRIPKPLLLLATLLVAPIHAAAGPFTVQAVGSAVTAAGSDSADTGVLVNTPFTHVSVGSGDTFAGATAFANAAPGTLGAFAGVTSLSSSFGGATASAGAAFSDVLTLFATGNFTGPVTLAFSLDIEGSLDGCAVCPAQGNVSSTFSVGATGSFRDGRSSVTYGRAFVGGVSNVSGIPSLPTIVLTTTIGDEISLLGNLSVFAGADGVGSFSTSGYGDTATFYVSVLTPGVTFVSASGARYSTVVPVPEPAAAWLVGAGLLLTASRMLKRRQGTGRKSWAHPNLA